MIRRAADGRAPLEKGRGDLPIGSRPPRRATRRLSRGGLPGGRRIAAASPRTGGSQRSPHRRHGPARLGHARRPRQRAASAQHAARSLPHHRNPGRRRNGMRLSRRRHAPGTHRGPQAATFQRGPLAGHAAALRARGAGHLRAQSSAHLRALRYRQSRRCQFPGDGVRGGRNPRRAPAQGAAGRGRRPRDRRPGGRRPGGRACQGHRPPRPQARKHHADGGWRQGAGLRAGHRAVRFHRRRSRDAHRRGNHRGHSGVHGPRTTGRPRVRQPDRHLRLRAGPL